MNKKRKYLASKGVGGQVCEGGGMKEKILGSSVLEAARNAGKGSQKAKAVLISAPTSAMMSRTAAV